MFHDFFSIIGLFCFMNILLKLSISTIWWGVLDTTLCDKVCQWLAAGLWFSLGTPVSNKQNWSPQYNWNIVDISGIKHLIPHYPYQHKWADVSKQKFIKMSTTTASFKIRFIGNHNQSQNKTKYVVRQQDCSFYCLIWQIMPRPFSKRRYPILLHT